MLSLLSIIYLLIHLFILAVLSLHCCMQAFSDHSAWTSCCAGFSSLRAPALSERGLSSYSAQAQLLRDMWNVSGPGFEPVFLALAGRFSTTGLPGKSLHIYLLVCISKCCTHCRLYQCLSHSSIRIYWLEGQTDSSVV